MKKIFGLLITLILITTLIQAQNEIDALRYSYHIPSGTARSNAMGGAFGALGADASVLSINPAGMGVYQNSDFTFSPGFVLTNTKAKYLGTTRTDYDFNINMSNIAYIGTAYTNTTGGHVSVNLGFAYNRLMDYNQNIAIEGINTENSLTDWFAHRAAGINSKYIFDQDHFYSGLAWETYLIDPHPDYNNQYISTFDNYGQTQRELINKNGYIGEYAFSIATNYLHQLYIGATLGFQSVRFAQTNIYEEFDKNDNINGFDSFTFKENFETKGSGFCFKLGILFRPVKWVRVGGAIHTPTFYKLNDTYYNSLNSEFSIPILEIDHDTGDSVYYSRFKYDSSIGKQSYELNSPFKAIGNIAFIINKQALVSIDYEYVNYAQARLRSDNYSYFNENENINNYFKAGHNIRVGAEYRFGPISLRAGGAYYDSPYKLTKRDSHTLIYSGGIGIRGTNMYFDVSYSYIANKEYYYMYQGYGVISPETIIKQNQNRIVTTLGFIF